MEKIRIKEGVLTIDHKNKTASFSPNETCFHVSVSYETAIAKINQ